MTAVPLAALQSVNPTTGEVLATFDVLSRSEIDEKLVGARQAFVVWRALSIAERAGRMREAAAVLRAHASELVSLAAREMGKPVKEGRAEIEKCAWVCEFYAEHAEAWLAPESVATDALRSYVRYDPLGVVLAVMPWNFPFWQVFRFAAPTLMAGNVGLLKHAENSTGAALAIERVFRDAGFAAGVFSSLLIRRESVAALIGDPRVAAVSLTGSLGAGQAVGAAAGAACKPCLLELGGSDPFIVLRDATLDQAVTAGLAARMTNSGQSCIAAKRFIVEERVHKTFVARLRDKLASLSVGDPLLDATDVGPLARPDLVQALDRQVQESIGQGARLVHGGKPRPGVGAFYEPTLLTEVVPGMPVFDEETFGPVAAVVRARDAEDAIALANRSSFGLGASVWTASARGEELAIALEAGHVAVNGIVKSDPRLPFGGIKQSGVGRELGRYGLLAFVNIKSVWVG